MTSKKITRFFEYNKYYSFFQIKKLAKKLRFILTFFLRAIY
ncbi:hypothetical protein DESAMIL20_37 [Desulfurella amilsii]|uniref:Uncharacterized protein n=1 Tax=Desulfurella amilsii TaxID=1562698 RepID=A0A1X4XZF6_9BACT|nr:hypothetical protein DESAMIL20_37 [Desulfurella amilsii]